MREITLKAVELGAFRSFREKQRIEISTGPGLKFLTGDNQLEPRLGANGAGKSTFLDAVFWCWYGVAVNGQRASELASWGFKRPEVSTMLDIDGEAFTIHRVGAPERLLINGEPAEQHQVDALLGLSRARAMQAIVFGQNAPFFTDLSIPHRGALLEEVLDLSIWQAASDEAKGEANAAQATVDELALAIAKVEGRLEGLPDIAQLEQEAAEWKAQHSKRLAAAQDRMEAEAAEYDRLEGLYEKAKQAAAGSALKQAQDRLDRFEREYAEAERLASTARGDVARSEKRLQHWMDDPTCETCGQHWPKSQRANAIEQLKAKLEIATAKLETYEASFKTHAAARKRARAELDEGLREDGGTAEAMRAAKRAMDKQAALCLDITGTVEALVGQKNPAKAAIARATQEKAELTARRRKLATERAQAMGEIEALRFWQDAFKRVRLYEVRRVLQHLELEVERAAIALGLGGWTISITTETETKSGTLKQGVQILVKGIGGAAPWESWSGGEGQRVRLAVAIGFATLIQRMSGVRFTFEFWDEPSAWLSEEGIEDLVATLKARSEVEQLSLWLVDHRALQAGAFDETWVATKTNKGSFLARK